MASLPEFIETGMAFFRGEMVAKPQFANMETCYNAAAAKVVELEGQLKTASLNLSDALEKDKAHAANLANAEQQVADLKAEVATLKSTIATLEANYENASKQAQSQLLKIGVTAPVSQGQPQSGGDANAFVASVAAKVASGKNKSTAILESITQYPAEYAEYLKSPTKL